MISPMAASLAHMREQGYECEIAEKWKRGVGGWVRSDLFGFGDILAIRGKDVVIVQTTSRANQNARIRKIQGNAWLPRCVTLGWTVVVHGWKKKKGIAQPFLTETIVLP